MDVATIGHDCNSNIELVDPSTKKKMSCKTSARKSQAF